MSKFIKLISLMLACLMLVSVLVSCNDTQQTDDPKESTDDSVATTVAQTEEEPKTKLPEMNWEGAEYRILGRQYTEDVFTNFEVDRDAMPEDVVGLAVWNRNTALMQKYGIDVVGTLVEKPFDSAKVFLDAGDDLYDLIICQNSNMQTFAMAGQLVNINNLNHINLEHDAWNDYANTQLTFGGKLYYTTNKFLLQDKHRTWIVWYNRTMARELNIGYLETEVFEGMWTLDRLIEIAKLGSAETNGEDGMTGGDKWGVTLSSIGNFAQLAYGSDFRLSDMGSDGYPTLIGATDRMVSILDKVLLLTSDTETCYVQALRPDGEGMSAAEIYREGRAVVMTHAVSWFSNLHRLDFEYGVLPAPKYTAEQDGYRCFPDANNGTLFAVPATIGDINKAGFGLQAISEESVATSYKEYVETKCKLQIAFDEDMSKCLNIIFDSIVYDIAFLDDYGGFAKVISSDIPKGYSNIYGRMYDKYKKKATNQIGKIKEAYAALPY